MKVRHNGHDVDVAAKCCPTLPCFYADLDKGPFVQGRGYVRTPETPRWVCGYRHLRGCPMVAKCTACNLVLGPSDQGRCHSCGSTEHVEPYPKPEAEVPS